MEDDIPDKTVVGFPYARSGVAKNKSNPRNLGLTAMSQAVSSSKVGAKGHWCSNCKGIWYSFFFEVECPVCGQRG